MKEKLHFSERLRGLMTQRGINNVELAQAIEVSHVAIGNFLNGQLPKSEHLYALSKYFGVSMDYLIGAKEQMLRTVSAAATITEALKGSEEERTIKGNRIIQQLLELQRALSSAQENLSSASDVIALLVNELQSEPQQQSSEEETKVPRVEGVSPIVARTVAGPGAMLAAEIVAEKEAERRAKSSPSHKAASTSGNKHGPSRGTAANQTRQKEVPKPVPERSEAGKPSNKQ